MPLHNLGKAPLDRGAPAKRVRGRPALMRKISPGTDESRRQNPIPAPEGRHLPDHPDTPESPDIPDSKVFEDKSFHIKPAGFIF